MSKLASDNGFNPFHTIDDLPLTDDQKEMVLEWYARKVYEAEYRNDPEYDGHHKSYDPLVIEGKTAHSYVFDLGDTCGRHHTFATYEGLEQKLDESLDRVISRIVESSSAESKELNKPQTRFVAGDSLNVPPT